MDAHAGLDSATPAGASAIERMILMQQERLERVEEDVVGMQRDLSRVVMPLAPSCLLDDNARVDIDSQEWDAFWEHVLSGATRANIVYRHSSILGTPVYEFRRARDPSGVRMVGGWVSAMLKGGHPPFLVGLPDGTATVRATPSIQYAADGLTYPLCITDMTDGPDRDRYVGERGWTVANLTVIDDMEM
jgi:hypothetical protein